MHPLNLRQNLRWRPRMSIRAALVFTLIAGVFFACGRLTKARGEREVTLYLTKTDNRPGFNTQSVAPFLYRNRSIVSSTNEPRQETTRQSYYLWFFGFVGKLPFETHRSRTIAGNLKPEFDETYFPVRSSTSRHRTAVPVSEWRMQYGDGPLLPGN